jgi:hypothetical protein
MEDFVLVIVSLLALRCQLGNSLGELIHRINRLRVVEHEGTCARHAEFNTLHSYLNFDI